ncbi:hypothetical protein [Streptomyces sp. A5-4]|uniref:hypothetical protein n=1 Tax=Streptomyces sp. A5-4 TaxID=3384771 RepID=UPI003DA9E016
MRRSVCGAVAGTMMIATLSLTGCGSGDGRGSDAGTSESAPSPSVGRSGGDQTGTSAPPPTGAPTPSASTPSAPSTPAPANERLVTVTVSGGFDGRHQSTLVNGDGSYRMLSHRPERPEHTGRMKPAELAELRTALAEADFAKLPRLNVADQPIADGLTTAVVHRGHEVVTDGSKPVPGLDRVIAALPAMRTGA